MKKQIPILFSTAMVEAELAGRKTQTRRMTGLTKLNEWPDRYVFNRFEVDNKGSLIAIFNDAHSADLSKSEVRVKNPYGKPGDILWVRETVGRFSFGGSYVYKTDELEPGEVVKWKPSIHMPKSAARIWLEVTDVRVERLKDISEEDAIAEGVRFTDFGKDMYGRQKRGFHVFDVSGPDQCLLTARTAFGNLFEKINGFGTWERNPWVWATSFRVLSTNGKPENI